MGRPGPVLLFLYIDTYFRIQGLFIKRNHIVFNLCFQNIFSLTKYYFCRKSGNLLLNLNTENRRCFQLILFPRSISKIRDPIIQYEDIFVRLCSESVNSRERFGICFKGPESLYLYDPQCIGSWSLVNVWTYSCIPADLRCSTCSITPQLDCDGGAPFT